jgi:hypothetical protein
MYQNNSKKKIKQKKFKIYLTFIENTIPIKTFDVFEIIIAVIVKNIFRLKLY